MPGNFFSLRMAWRDVRLWGRVAVGELATNSLNKCCNKTPGFWLRAATITLAKAPQPPPRRRRRPAYASVASVGGRESIRAGHHGNVRGVSDEQLPARKPVKVKRERLAAALQLGHDTRAAPHRWSPPLKRTTHTLDSRFWRLRRFITTPH
jgi:hypothetical protein